MAYASENQAAIAQNIANADTPRYKPRVLEKPDFSKLVEGQNTKMGMVVTHPGHIQGGISGLSGGRFKVKIQTGAPESKPNGNAVDIEKEVMKMAENSMDYQATTSLYKRMTEIVRLATGGNR